MTRPLETPSKGRRSWFGRRQRTRSRTQLGAQDHSLFTRSTEATAQFIGTSEFILWITMFVVVWIAANLVLNTQTGMHNPWNPYPSILLNLVFSTQASYAAPLIIFTQNRQDDRDRVIAEQDRQRAAHTLANTEYLAREIAVLRLAVSELATRDFVRSELRDLLADLESREVTPSANDSGADIQLRRAAIQYRAMLRLCQIHEVLTRISGCKLEVSPDISMYLATSASGRLSMHPE